MGSWNETCALTRLPIISGDTVVKFNTVSVPSVCFSSIHEMGTVPLMLGLFSRGTYDDYGAVTLDSDALTVNNEIWCEDALISNNFWRAIPIEGAPDNPNLIPLEGQQLLYGMLGAFDFLSAPNENYSAYSKWLSAACNAYAAANKIWADSLGAEKPLSLADVQSALCYHGATAFQERWSVAKAWMHAKGLLVAEVGHILMHRAAFDAVVRAARTASQEKTWMKAWAEWQAIDTELKAVGAKQGWTRSGSMEWVPLSKPYRTSDTPIHSHYWHTVEPGDALQRISMDDLVQYNAFVKGFCSTRINLEAGHPGGQDNNRKLMAAIMKSVRPR